MVRTVKETGKVGKDTKSRCSLPLGDLHVMLEKIVVNDHHGGFKDGKGRVDSEHKEIDKQEAHPVLSSLELSQHDGPST